MVKNLTARIFMVKISMVRKRSACESCKEKVKMGDRQKDLTNKIDLRLRREMNRIEGGCRVH